MVEASSAPFQFWPFPALAGGFGRFRKVRWSPGHRAGAGAGQRSRRLFLFASPKPEPLMGEQNSLVSYAVNLIRLGRV